MRHPRPNLVALLASFLPGLGHLFIGRSRRGLLLFVGATLFANIAFLSWIAPVAPLGTTTLRVGLGIAGALVLFSVVDIFRIAVYARLPRSSRAARSACAKPSTTTCGVSFARRGDHWNRCSSWILRIRWRASTWPLSNVGRDVRAGPWNTPVERSRRRRITASGRRSSASCTWRVPRGGPSRPRRHPGLTDQRVRAFRIAACMSCRVCASTANASSCRRRAMSSLVQTRLK